MKKSANPSQWSEEDWAYHNKKPWDWSEVEWENVYELYCAVQLRDLDSSIEFSEFKKQILEDKEFASYHKLKPGMDSKDYNPME